MGNGPEPQATPGRSSAAGTETERADAGQNEGMISGVEVARSATPP